MSDGNGHAGTEQAAPVTPTDIQLVVTLHPNGQVSISGPLDNRIFCLGLLEMAKDVLAKFAAEKEPRIIRPDLRVLARPLNGG